MDSIYNGHIWRTRGLHYVLNEPVIIYENNIVVIDKIKHGYLKGDNTKHILLKLLFTHETKALKNNEVQHIGS